MTLALSKKIVLALSLLALVATAGFLGTRAFFSDIETSQGNVFAAGSLDLEIGITGAGDDTDFAPQSIPGNQSLFIFGDMLPGDSETGFFRLESSEDAWACIAAEITDEDENNRLDIEQDAGDGTPNVGELSEYVEFAFWEANNNNANGIVGANETDTLRVVPLQVFANGDYYYLQDSVDGDNPLFAGTEDQYEFAYCFGEFSNTAAVQANGGTLECDGASVSNEAQTDRTEMTIHFYAEQMENNDSFVCGSLNPYTVVTGTGWSSVATTKTWFGKWRGANGNFELAVGNDDTVNRDTEEFSWVSGTEYDFKLDYDGDIAKLYVDNVELASYDVTEAGVEDAVAFNIKATDTGLTTTINDLTINTQLISAQTIATNGENKSIVVSGVDTDAPFTVTGSLIFDFTGNPEEKQALQVSIK